MIKYLLSCFCFWLMLPAFSQRNYVPHSVLANGNWVKVAIKEAGVYRLDIPFLNQLGLQVNGMPSSSIRVFGTGGAMLSEANSINRLDDLPEMAIMVIDGGDGIFNGADFILFY